MSTYGLAPNPAINLASQLWGTLQQGRIPALPDGVGLFYGFQHQALRAVPIGNPTLVWVLAGCKECLVGESMQEVSSGELMILPANMQVHLRNQPDADGRYLALCLTVTEDEQDWLCSQAAPNTQQTICKVTPQADFVCSFQQWIELAAQFPLPAGIQRNRRRELLDWLLSSGQAGNLLARVPEYKRRVLQLIHSDIAYPWRLSDMADRLHVSESTLHRQLSREGTSFRQLLEQTRLATALGMLQGTRLSITEIAGCIGYQSPSRFAERFRQHFGLSPSELRNTQENDNSKREFDGLRRAHIGDER